LTHNSHNTLETPTNVIILYFTIYKYSSRVITKKVSVTTSCRRTRSIYDNIWCMTVVNHNKPTNVNMRRKWYINIYVWEKLSTFIQFPKIYDIIILWTQVDSSLRMLTTIFSIKNGLIQTLVFDILGNNKDHIIFSNT